LGLNVIDRKEAFTLAVALGCDSPRKIDNPYSPGLILTKSFNTSDLATISSTLLGNAQTDEEVEQATNLDNIIAHTEQCAESGFDILWKEIDSAEGDEDLLERRLLSQMDTWYKANVENPIN